MANPKGHTFDVDRAIHNLRFGMGRKRLISELAYEDIGWLFGVSRQAVHKRHKAYLSSSKGGGRRRPKEKL